jgi:uncharacterized protein involved in outer membrane biogenesis
MKRLKWIGLGVAGLVVVGLIVVWLNLNGIVRRTVETQASSSLDLQTTLGGARVSIFGGNVTLSDLAIASPPDFKAPHMLSLGSAGVQVGLGELRRQPVHIQRISIDKPTIVIEANGPKLNFQVLLDRPSTSPPGGSSPTASEPIKLIIDELDVTGAQVALRPGVSIPGLKEEYAVSIPTLSLQNIGNGHGAQNGAAIKDVVTELLAAAASKAGESDQLPSELRNLLKLNADDVIKQVQSQVTEKVTKELEKNFGKDTGDAIKQGMDDLLKKKQKKQK